jgi:tRNA-modifying protein YgfZ
MVELRGAVDRTGRGLLHLTGPQRLWFLHQTVTADVEELAAGTWKESAFLTPKGKMVAHFYVGALTDEVFVEIDPPHTELADWLMRYRFRTKVEIEDVSGPVLTVIGDRAAELAGDGEIVRRNGAVVFGHRLGDVPLADVHGPLAELDDVERTSPDVLEMLRVEAGVPRFGVDYTTDNLPQEGGLSHVVPVDRGCYVGQETIARIFFRGHVNKVVRPVTLEETSPETALGADLLLLGKPVGTVTSAVVGRSGDTIGLAMARVEPVAGTRLDVSSGGSAVLGPVPEGTKVKPS